MIEDNEALIKMIIKCSTLDETRFQNLMSGLGTPTNRLLTFLTKGSFSRHRWLQLTKLFNSTTLESYDRHLSVLISSVPCNSDHLMAKRLGESSNPMSMSQPRNSLTSATSQGGKRRIRRKMEVKTKCTQAGASTWRNPAYLQQNSRGAQIH